MRSAGKGSQDEDDYEDDDFGSKKDAPSSNSSNPGGKDAKNNDKASAIRSKHSVTEQRRRSKINERFQILRDLIPHSEQKRDTASFLLEVIEYVQYLQERVNKHEGQGWSSEPTKLMPWRNSHWRVQSFVGNPQAIKSDPAVIAPFSGKFDENISITPNILANSTQNPLESDPSRDVASKMMDQQPEIIVNKGLPAPIALLENLLPPVRSDSMLAQPLHVPISDAQSTQGPTTSGAALSQQEELTIEGGTISISSIYSQGLLSSLSQALQSAGVDLSQATVSVQIDLGNRANRRLSAGAPVSKDHENPHSSNQTMAHFRDAGSGDDSDQAHKRLKS